MPEGYNSGHSMELIMIDILAFTDRMRQKVAKVTVFRSGTKQLLIRKKYATVTRNYPQVSHNCLIKVLR